MVKRFFKTTWVFFTAVAAIAASTALLAFGIEAVHAAEQTSVSRIGTPPVVIAAVEQTEGADTSGFTMPDVLMTYTDTGFEPTAKDVKAQQAAETSARMVAQVFGADLDGEIGRLAYYGPESSGMPGRGEWYVSFGDYTPGAYFYTVRVDSVSGLALYLNRSEIYSENAEPEEAREVGQQEYDTLIQAYNQQAEEITLRHFALGRDVLSVEPAPPAYDAPVPYTTDQMITVRVVLEDGAVGATVEVLYRLGDNMPETITYTPSPSALYPMETPVPTEKPASEVTVQPPPEEPAVEDTVAGETVPAEEAAVEEPETIDMG